MKKITQLLNERAPVLKRGVLTKQGEKASGKIESRYVVLTPREVKYWHDEPESVLGAGPLAEIPLKYISNVMSAQRMKSTSDFFITAGHWRKKGEQREMREFVFGADSDSERDAWITAILFLRA